MEPLQLNEEERDILDALDRRHRSSRATMEDFYRHHMETLDEIRNDAYAAQSVFIEKYGLDPTLDYKIEKEKGIMTEYTPEQQEEDGVWEFNSKSNPLFEDDAELLKWGEINQFLRDNRGKKPN